MDSWNMLTNNSTNCTNELGIQNMEIKLEPIDPDETTEPLELTETMHNNANNVDGNLTYFPRNHNMHTNGSTEGRYPNERKTDNMIFDFGLNSTFGNGEMGNSLTSTSNELAPLSAEDQYYLSLIKFEDSIVYICPACGEEFRAQEVWKRHLNTMHNYNTRHGLNFIRLDKLYHKCLECNKRIAMHSMENLLKHKFTHLPYRCSKCNVCKREYKYRQDLMVHIRMIHRDELLAEVKHGIEDKHKRHRVNSNNLKMKAGLAIGDVKENAYDIFENSCDNVEIKTEFIDPNDPYDIVIPPKRRLSNGMATIPVSSSYIEDVSSTDSISQSDPNDVDGSLEEYILFNCPQCSLECESHAEWRQHIDFVHDFGTSKGLNFQDINMKQQQAQCLECRQVLTPNTISNLQNHKFSHLSDREWLKCKLCFSSFSSNKRIIEHLEAKHRLLADNVRHTATANNIIENAGDDSHDNYDFSGFDDYDNSAGAADTKILLSGKDIYSSHTEEHDKYEKYIEYICPKCGKEYADKNRWRKHLINAHQLADFHKLNFDIIKDRQLKCRECKKIITNAYDIQNAQQHSITHMKYNGFARCRLCLKSYTDRKTLYKHLHNTHSVDIVGVSKRLLSSKSTADANYNGNSMNGKVITVSKQKEIVQFGDFTYEIYYLDEDNTSPNMGISSSKDDEDFDEECSEYIFNKSLQQAHCHKCKNCGAIFSTHPALLFHIKNEHGSIHTNNNSSNTSRQNSEFANEDLSNDGCDDLLVPTGDVDIQLEEAVNIDCNFIYLCPECGEEFRIQSLWRRHINIEHNFDKRDFLDFRCIDKFHYQCNICKDIVQSSKLKGLQDHKFRHCPYKLYLKCLLCGICYNHKPNMLSHLRQRHNIMYYQESSNTANNSQQTKNIENTNSKHIKPPNNDHSNGSSSNSGFRATALQTVEDVISFHNAVDHDSITYHCPSCYENFTSHAFWRKHIVEVHKLNNREGLNFRKLDKHHYVCLQCDKTVTVTHTKGAIGQLQSHKFRHLPYKSFRCTVCQAQFVRKQMFFKHLDTNTNKCNGYCDEFYPGNNDRSSCDQYDDEFDLSGALVQRNGGDIDKMGADLWSSRYSLQSASNDSSTDKQDCYTVNCPQCGAHFEGVRAWREHINTEHKLNTSSALNLKKISSRLHQCLQCHEYLHDSKLYELQVHRFKHLPYGAYIHCRYCRMSCYHFGRMEEHLKRKHPQMLHKTPDDMGYYNADEDCTTMDGELGEPIDLDANGDEYPDCDKDAEMDAIDTDGYAQADNALDADEDVDMNDNANAADVNVDTDGDVMANANADVDIAANANVDDDDVVIDADTEVATNINVDTDVEKNDGLNAEDNCSSDVVDLVEVEADIEEVDPDAADSEEQYLLG